MSRNVLIIEDERAIREELADFLYEEGFSCVVAATGQEGIERVDDRDFDAIMLDIRLPDMTGIQVLERLRNLTPESHVLIMTAHPSVETVVSALRLGAADYVTKPLILEELLQKLRRLIEFRAQQMEIKWYRHQLQAECDYSNIIGKSPRMKEVFRLAERVATTDSPVLIVGESGTGKELIAGAIHHNSPRKDRRFVPLNCTAIPPALLESKLFGHVKGAFAGADSGADGLLATANGGTLLLDEIGKLPLELQPKLLRAIEQRCFLPVGATEPIEVDTRIIALTNVDLRQAVEQGSFLEELFYGLAIVTIDVPPLRDRQEDIPDLIDHFMATLSRKLKRNIRGVTAHALRRLMRYRWRGNVRELQNVMERAIIIEESDFITPTSLPSNLIAQTHPAETIGPLKDAVREFEQEYINRILKATRGDKRLAAELLGVSVSSIYRRLQAFEEDAEAAKDSIVGESIE